MIKIQESADCGFGISGAANQFGSTALHCKRSLNHEIKYSDYGAGIAILTYDTPRLFSISFTAGVAASVCMLQ